MWIWRWYSARRWWSKILIGAGVAFVLLIVIGLALGEEEEPLAADPVVTATPTDGPMLEPTATSATGPSITPPPPSTPRPTATPRPPTLTLEAFNCTLSSESFVRGEGEVTNTGGARLENVLAVVTWRAADDTFITSDDALIDFDPLLPGQSSPFSVISRFNPAMEGGRCSVQFRFLFGDAIDAERRP